MKTPVKITITGAAGHIGYALVFRIASGAMFGPDQPVILRLLEIPQALEPLNGVGMELEDCALPLLCDIVLTDDPAIGFREADYAILIGAVLGGILVNTHFSLKTSSSKVESIFVGNLAFKASARALRELFEYYGEVHAVRLMTDRQTRRPRGYGFVEMSARDAKNAIAALNGSEFYGRELKVNVANERKN